MHTNSTDNGDVCFVIPTYNKAENIIPLLRRILNLDAHWRVLIVDDDSPDGTAARVRDAQNTLAGGDRVHLSGGTKRGLGAAYKRGMAVAMHELRAGIIVQMDADHSHDPAQCLQLIQSLRDGAEVAIGSRYIVNASIDKRWHKIRRWLSGGGNWLAKRIAGIHSVRDCTSGFRAIRVSALARMAVEKLPVNGYAFQIALLHRLVHYDARVVECPIHFAQRLSGKTKLGWFDLLEFFISVWILRFPSARTFFKFGIIGLSGVLVNLSAFYLLTKIGAHTYFASPVAVELSILWNFFFNNAWTFNERELVGNKLVRGLTFNAISLGTLVLSFATFVFLSAAFPQFSPLLHQTAAILPAALFNYFLNSYWTFSDAGTSQK